MLRFLFPLFSQSQNTYSTLFMIRATAPFPTLVSLSGLPAARSQFVKIFIPVQDDPCQFFNFLILIF